MRPRRHAKIIGVAAVVAWVLLATADILDAVNVAPGLPLPLHSLAVGACVTGAILAAWLHHQVPIEAAFLHGKLDERANPGGPGPGSNPPPVKMAAGDDSGGIVMQFPRGKVYKSRHAPSRDPRR